MGRVADPASPAAGGKDPMNRPLGEVPSGVPSVAGNQSQQAAAGGGKISSTYPPIFYARPGESWELYWRSVTFWIASEGRSLPEEMRGPRLMQQLRERAANIVQHLSVEQVAASNGVELIRQTMEKSPIIKLLDQKRVDQRRKKFMRLSRLPQESIESFINRAEIYRRENQSSPAYQVGSQFYVGHLLDAAKLTKRDHALVKAACGGTVEDEDLVTNALIDLADQLEGLPGCAIGKGEPTMDQEDKYLVQKGGVALSSTMSSSSSTASSAPSGGKRRKKFFGRRRFRDALMAILEDDDMGEDDIAEEDPMGEPLGEESMDEDEEDMTSFAGGAHNTLEVGAAPSSQGSSSSTTSGVSNGSSPNDLAMAEIYAQEYKARNRVRESKKMRQYFQKEGNGMNSGNSRDREQVRRWVKEQQKTEPCFICRQLGHWSQECPYRNKAPVHASNVTFPVTDAQSEGDWAYLIGCAESDARYKERPLQQRQIQPSCNFMVETPKECHQHEIYWSLSELSDKMILDLGCMKTVAGTTWINPVVQKWKQHGHYVRVVPESESFRFGDGHVNRSRFAVILHVSIAGIPCLLRISVVAGDCPPLLSKPVCSELGLVVDTSKHTISSTRHGVKAFGMSQSKGGHYTLKIDDLADLQAVPEHAVLEPHREVMALRFSSGSKTGMPQPPDCEQRPSGVPQAHGRISEFEMGECRDGRFSQFSRTGGSESQRPAETVFFEETSPAVDQVEETGNLSWNQSAVSAGSGAQPRTDGSDATDAGPDARDVHADAECGHGGARSRGLRGQEGQASGQVSIRAEQDQGQAETGGSHQSPGRLPDSVQRVLRRCDLQHSQVAAVADGDVQNGR